MDTKPKKLEAVKDEATPSKIDEVEALRLRVAQLEMEKAQTIYEQARREFARVQTEVSAKYGLVQGDGIDLPSGKITRKPI